MGMWPFKKKAKVLAKPIYRFKGERLVYCEIPAGRTSGQVAIWRQEVACAFIEYNGPTLGSLGAFSGLGINFQEHNQ